MASAAWLRTFLKAGAELMGRLGQAWMHRGLTTCLCLPESLQIWLLVSISEVPLVPSASSASSASGPCHGVNIGRAEAYEWSCAADGADCSLSNFASSATDGSGSRGALLVVAGETHMACSGSPFCISLFPPTTDMLQLQEFHASPIDQCTCATLAVLSMACLRRVAYASGGAFVRLC